MILIPSLYWIHFFFNISKHTPFQMLDGNESRGIMFLFLTDKNKVESKISRHTASVKKEWNGR